VEGFVWVVVMWDDEMAWHGVAPCVHVEQLYVDR
jgi:hypothetical protein